MNDIQRSQAECLSEINRSLNLPQPSCDHIFTQLAQHHCLENLEFTWDAADYCALFVQSSRINRTNHTCRSGDYFLSRSWEKLMQDYFVPGAPKELNISGQTRDRLLSLTSQPVPPSPRALDNVCRQIRELIHDTLEIDMIPPEAPPTSTDFECKSQHSFKKRLKHGLKGLSCFCLES